MHLVDRHTSTKAVRIKIWEDRNRCKNAPFQAAGMHVGNRAVQRGSAAMVEVSKIERGYGANSIYLSNLKNGHR